MDECVHSPRVCGIILGSNSYLGIWIALYLFPGFGRRRRWCETRIGYERTASPHALAPKKQDFTPVWAM